MTKDQRDINYAWLGLFAAIGGFFRAWFGGSFKHVSRGWKYLLLIVTVIGMYWSKGLLDWYNWRMYAVIAAFAYHWAKGHGDYFKVNDTSVDEARIKWIDWILQKIYGKGNYYDFKGNVTGMLIRYTSTSILVAAAVPSYWAIAMGPAVAISYGLMGKLFPNGYYTKYAEIMAGALCFSILWIIL